MTSKNRKSVKVKVWNTLKKGDIFLEYKKGKPCDAHIYLGSQVEGGFRCFHSVRQNVWYCYTNREIMEWEFLCSIPNDSAGNLTSTEEETPAELLLWNPETETYSAAVTPPKASR